MSDVAASGGYYIACEADSILEHTLIKPVVPLNLTESEVLQSQKSSILSSNLKENLTH